MEKKIGSNLKKARKKAGLTQGQLANSTGLSITSISAYENDNGKPGIDSLARISKALNVSLDSLYFGNSNQIKLEDEASGKEIAKEFALLYSWGYISTVKYQPPRNHDDSDGYYYVEITDSQSQIKDLLGLLKSYVSKYEYFEDPASYLGQIISSTGREIDQVHEDRERFGF